MADIPRENMPSPTDKIEVRKRLRAQVTTALPKARNVLKKSGLKPEEHPRTAINIAGELVREDLKGEVDKLTGIWNRDGFIRRGKEELERSRRLSYKVAVIILDLNFLKQTNDTLGHNEGDNLIKRAAECLKAATRETDTVARIGGDEFGAVLASASYEGVAEWWKRANLLFNQQNINLGAGVAMTNPEDLSIHSDWEEKLNEYKKLADKALYLAKEKAKQERANVIENYG